MLNKINGLLWCVHDYIVYPSVICYWVIMIATFFNFESIKISDNNELNSILLTIIFIFPSYLILLLITSPVKYNYFVSYFNKGINEMQNEIVRLDSKLNKNDFKLHFPLNIGSNRISKIKFIGRERLVFENREQRMNNFIKFIKDLF